jgi:peptidoglycan/xylan/chitin deacetylase (PgdA/CDA1 family)
MKEKLKEIIKQSLLKVLSPVVKTRGPGNFVYLTFDDGPHRVYTPKALNSLDRHGFKATFFFNGELMDRHAEIVDRVVDEGHQVGYHSYRHERASKWDIFACYKDLSAGRRLLRRHNVDELLYRPPYGELSVLLLLMLILRGWKIIMWSHEGGDSFYSEKEILKNLEEIDTEDGSIVLLHDVYPRTINILPKFLNDLASSGLSAERLSFK